MYEKCIYCKQDALHFVYTLCLTVVSVQINWLCKAHHSKLAFGASGHYAHTENAVHELHMSAQRS